MIKTPVFDRVARDGVLFARAYCASPSCTPSASVILKRSREELYDCRICPHQLHNLALDPAYRATLRKLPARLTAYANVEYDRRTQAPHASMNVWIEGLTKEGEAYVNSEAYRLKQMDKVCSRREQKIIMGASNGGYHYLGSAKIMAQIGKAFAEAMLEMESK